MVMPSQDTDYFRHLAEAVAAQRDSCANGHAQAQAQCAQMHKVLAMKDKRIQDLEAVVAQLSKPAQPEAENLQPVQFGVRGD